MPSSDMSMWILLGLTGVTLASWWVIYSKAGEAGWKVLVPIYGTLVYLRMTGRPWWWLVLVLVPVVNVILMIMSCFDLARVFNKSTVFGLGLLFLGPVFWMVLAFGGATYVGPSRAPAPATRRAA